MFKKLLLSVILVLCLAVAGLACTLPNGTQVFIFTPQGMMAAIVPGDKQVEPIEEQPPAEMLKEFSTNNPQVGDWTDGVAVFDKAAGVYVLVHKGDLIPCEGKEPSKK